MTIRTHKVKIIIDYEGEPLDQKTLDDMVVHLCDNMCLTLIDRHEGADQICTIGAAHDIDTHLED